MSAFHGVCPVVHLPVGDGGTLDLAGIARQVEWTLAFGVSGIATLGLATEVGELAAEERLAVCAATVEAVAGRVPVVAGVDGDTASAAAEGRRLLDLGVRALMVRPPPVDGPDELIEHYVATAEAVDAPVLVQDAPRATGVRLPVEVLLTMADASAHLRSVKVEEVGAGAKISALVAAGVDVVAGWGGLHYLDSLRRGAVGCMPGCDLAPAFVEIHRLAGDGLTAKADDLYRAVLPLLSYESQSLTLLVLGAKLALVRAGVLDSAAMRLPAGEIDDIHRATLTDLVTRLSLDEIPGFT